MAESSDPVVRRVLLALDASPFGLEALDAAAHLAAELHAELRAVFVEDINLVHLAGLPFAREISFSSAASRQLDLRRVERALQADADLIRRALANTCHQVRVEWSFSVMRGHVTRMPLQAAAESDVLIMGREGARPAQSATLGRRAAERPIAVVYDGSPSAWRAVETAGRLALSGARRIVVLVADPTGKRQEELRGPCSNLFAALDVSAEYQPASLDAPSLVRLARQCHARMLVVNRDNPMLDEQTVEALGNQLECPVGIVL